MDYKVFFGEIADWISNCNKYAMRHGLDSEVFWRWVATSLGELSNKYNNNPLVQSQTVMLYGWLMDVYESAAKENSNGS